MPITITDPAEMVAAIRADLERLEEQIGALCDALPYRESSSVSYAVDRLRQAAEYLDYANVPEPRDFDEPHILPEDFAV